MNMIERTTAVGVFIERNNAERAIAELARVGFSNEQIGFITRGQDTIMPPTIPATHASTVDGSPAATPAVTDTAAHDSITGYSRAEATAAGAAGGGVLGGIMGAAASLLIPGFGPAIAGGVLAATLGGLVIGAVAGGFVGALVQMGIPEEEAQYYQDELNAGRSIVTVKAGERYLDALNILRYNGAYDATARYVDEDNSSKLNTTGEPAPFVATETPTNAASNLDNNVQTGFSPDDTDNNDLTEKYSAINRYKGPQTR